jgi:hypothetical protein
MSQKMDTNQPFFPSQLPDQSHPSSDFHDPLFVGLS